MVKRKRKETPPEQAPEDRGDAYEPADVAPEAVAGPWDAAAPGQPVTQPDAPGRPAGAGHPPAGEARGAGRAGPVRRRQRPAPRGAAHPGRAAGGPAGAV